ncbi:MAG TPA: hypothetical protein VIR01_15885, partial [Pyrinomonadaceae bacterium]
MTSDLKRTIASVAGLAIFVLFATATSKKPDNTNNSNSVRPPHNSSVATTKFNSSSEKFSGTLDQYKVDFSFDYPTSWKRDDKAGKGASPNFVKVERMSDDEITLENFAVGY